MRGEVPYYESNKVIFILFVILVIMCSIMIYLSIMMPTGILEDNISMRNETEYNVPVIPKHYEITPDPVEVARRTIQESDIPDVLGNESDLENPKNKAEYNIPEDKRTCPIESTYEICYYFNAVDPSMGDNTNDWSTAIQSCMSMIQDMDDKMKTINRLCDERYTPKDIATAYINDGI